MNRPNNKKGGHTLKLKGLIIALACVTVAAAILFASGIIVTDRSAVLSAEGLSWKGDYYLPCTGYYREGKTLAKTSDGSWSINEVSGDGAHNFVVARSGTDDALYVRSDYIIPESGVPETVYLGSEQISDSEHCEILSDIYRSDTESFSLTASSSDVDEWIPVSIAYDSCPVAIFRGYLGSDGDEYFFTVDLSDMTEKDDGSGSPFTVICKLVNEDYFSAVDKYFLTD